MTYGSKPTKALHDRGLAPRESFPLVYAIVMNDLFEGPSGRSLLRKRLGPEHETSHLSLSGRGFPIWSYTLRDEEVVPSSTVSEKADPSIVYILGPTAKKFIGIEATVHTTGPEAAVILTHVTGLLGVNS